MTKLIIPGNLLFSAAASYWPVKIIVNTQPGLVTGIGVPGESCANLSYILNETYDNWKRTKRIAVASRPEQLPTR